MERSAQEIDQIYAQWYVWARRELNADATTCLAAAHAALEELARSGDQGAAQAAARQAVGRPNLALLLAVPPRRRQYAESSWAATHPPTGLAVDDRPATARTPGAEQVRPRPRSPGPPAVPLPPADLVVAGFWRRLAAALVDTAILAIELPALGFAVLVAVAIVQASASETENVDLAAGPALIVIVVLQIMVSWLYSAALESSGWRATVGKRVVGLEVTDLDGRPVSFARASARYAAKALVILTAYLGFLMIALPGMRQGVHDIVAGTLVVKRKTEKG
jgi:uncharacterized RDD family membrane protein YckC